MQDENKSQVFVIAAVLILLILVLISAIVLAVQTKNKHNEIDVKFKQIYSSDMILRSLGDEYFIGSETDNYISCIIDKKGQEILRDAGNIYYDGYYKTKEDNYLFYDVSHEKLITFYFDGEKIQYVFDIEDVSYAKPIVYKKGTQEYILGFFSKKDDDLYLYLLNNTGIIVLKDTSLLADYDDEGIYYTNSSKYLIVKNKEELVGAINLEGKTIIDFKYKDLLNTYDDSFIAVNKKNEYGIIDTSLNKMIDFKYKAIIMDQVGYLIVDQKNKMALYDREYKKVIGFEMNYNTLIDYDMRSTNNSAKLWEVGNNLVIVNNYLEGYNKTEYNNHDLYVIRNGKIVKKVNQIGFGSNGLIYSYDKDFIISIYDIDFNVIATVKLSNVKRIMDLYSLNENKVFIKYCDSDDKVYYKLFDGNTLYLFEYGDLVYKTKDYYIFRKDNKLTIYDNEFRVINEIIANKYEFKNGYIIADNSIYILEGKSK